MTAQKQWKPHINKQARLAPSPEQTTNGFQTVDQQLLTKFSRLHEYRIEGKTTSVKELSCTQSKANLSGRTTAQETYGRTEQTA